MKIETVIGTMLLVLFIVTVYLGGFIADRLVYMIGCFAIGWNIPAASEKIAQFIKRKTA